jgi:hypothetical protein
VFSGHYVLAGVVGLELTQGNWSREGEPIRLCLMSGAMALLIAAVLLLVRRSWSWWATLVSLVVALGAFGVVTVAFLWMGDPNRWDAKVWYLGPFALGILLLVWLLAFFAALCGLAALAGLLVLLRPATRREFRLRHGGATGQASRTRRCRRWWGMVRFRDP